MRAFDAVPLEASPSDLTRQYLDGFINVLRAVPAGAVARVTTVLADAWTDGRHVFAVGNGGSASTASHLAGDFGKNLHLWRPEGPRVRFRATSLTDNVAWMTAIANDIGYEHVFAEQLANLARPGDVVCVISASGSSPNVVRAAIAARELGARVVALVGCDGGRMRELADECIVVPSGDYGYIESAHLLLAHFFIAVLGSGAWMAAAAARS